MREGILGETESIKGAAVHLSFERWYHISEGHPELAGQPFDVLETVGVPDLVVGGSSGEYLALSKVNNKYLVVVYKEITRKQGFVITAFFTTDIKSLLKKRKIIWKKQ